MIPLKVFFFDLVPQYCAEENFVFRIGFVYLISISLSRANIVVTNEVGC